MEKMRLNEIYRVDKYPRERYIEEHPGYYLSLRDPSGSFKYPKATYTFMLVNHNRSRKSRHIGSVYLYYQEDDGQECIYLYIYSCESSLSRDCVEIQIMKNHPLPDDLEEQLKSIFRYDMFDETSGQIGYQLCYMNDPVTIIQILKTRYPELNHFHNQDALISLLPLVMYYTWNDRNSVNGIICRDDKTCFMAPYLGNFQDLNMDEKTAEKIVGVPAYVLERYNRIFAYTDVSRTLSEKWAREKLTKFMRRIPDLFEYVAFSFPATAECIRLLSDWELDREEAISILSFVGTYAFSKNRWEAYKDCLLKSDQLRHIRV